MLSKHSYFYVNKPNFYLIQFVIFCMIVMHRWFLGAARSRCVRALLNVTTDSLSIVKTKTFQTTFPFTFTWDWRGFIHVCSFLKQLILCLKQRKLIHNREKVFGDFRQNFSEKYWLYKGTTKNRYLPLIYYLIRAIYHTFFSSSKNL